MALSKKLFPKAVASGVTGTDNFAPVAYTGNGGTQSITSLDFQPDFVWIKNRDSGTANHRLYNSITYGGPVADGNSTSFLKSNKTDQESSSANTLTSLDSNGFSLYGTGGETNASGNDYVAWCWKAGGAAVSNTNGSITSTVSANPDAGFSIVKINSATGTSADTIGHGLSQAPEMIFYKTTSTTGNWSVYHSALGNTKGVYLNLTSAAVTSQFFWNNTSPTSSVFTAYGSQGNSHIAYCFHSVDGYQKVGSYTGTGATGNTVTTGFEPRFVLIKGAVTPNNTNWWIFDNVRNPSNPLGKGLIPNLSAAEQPQGTYLNFVSNGFTWLSGNGEFNSLNDTYIYLAIA